MPSVRRIGARTAWHHGSNLTDPDRDSALFVSSAQRRREAATSCVYFIECGEYIKIGTTVRTPQHRIDELQYPPNARVVAVIVGPGYEAESQLHRMFAGQRVKGEWFTRSPELDAVIATFAV